MAFGLFRMMFSAGGNAVPVLEQMNSASQKLLQTSSGLSTNLRQAGASMTTLVSATSNLSQFHAFEQSIAKVNSQASFLQSTLLDMAGTIKRLGIESLGVSEQMLSLYTIEELLSDENEMLTASAKATAQAFLSVAESVRTVGATGQVTSSRLASLSQTLQLFGQNTGKIANVELQNFSNRLIQASSQMKMAEIDARRLSNANLSLSDTQRLAHNETNKISDALARFSVVGGMSSGVILKMANQLNTLSTSVHPKFSGALRTASTELITFGNQLRMTEQEAAQAGKANGGFQMMTDVSAGAATRMRQLSSGAQGAMIAMSLLQRNVMGLAFSLIFLQFSGFLKLSLAVAGTLAAVGGAALGVKALIKEGSRIKRMSDQFFILTGSAEASGLAVDAARVLAEKYGISANTLGTVQLENLISQGILNNEEFDTFGALLALSDAGVLDNVDSTESLIQKFIKLTEEGKDTDAILQEFKLTTDSLREALENLDKSPLGQKQRELAELKNSFSEAFTGASALAGGFWDDFSRGWILAATGFFLIGSGQWKEGFTSLFGGLGEVITSVVDGLGALMGNLIIAILIAPFTSGLFIVNAILNKFFGEGLAQIIKDGMLGAIKWTYSGWLTMFNWTKGFIGLIDTEIFSGFVLMGTTIYDAFVDFGKTAFEGWLMMFEKAKEGGKAVLDEVKKWFSFDLWNGLGIDAIKGLLAGLLSIDLLPSITDIGKLVITGFKKVLGQESPSKEMIKVGQQTMEGFRIGMGGISNGGGKTNNISINVNISGAFSNNPRSAGNTAANQILNGITRSGSFSSAPLMA